MARRAIDKLSPAAVRNANRPGLYGDGGGLWLHVGETGGKSWLYRYMLYGRAREMGLGPLHTIGLSEARERARAARKLCLDGLDPLDARNAEKERRTADAAAAVSFEKAAEGYIKANKAGWSNAKHADQWTSTLTTYAYPVIGKLAVGQIDTGHITKILEPIWSEKPETASRVRGRIESVLDYARVKKWRTGENPARWKGHLDQVLPAKAKVAKVEHHAALPWREIGAFVKMLESETGTAVRALRFAILTAARTGEVIGARWSEIDLKAGVWTVPPERMKANREHRVPLTDEALAVLGEMRDLSTDPDGLIFPGGKGVGGLSNMAMLAFLKRIKRTDLTVHGFRSTFRDWAAETGKPNDIAEAALAHTLGDKTQAAYQRGDLLDRRRRLMTDWAAFCGKVDDGDGDNVVPLRAGAVA
jgi:integrase